jgi:hypothetical protein
MAASASVVRERTAARRAGRSSIREVCLLGVGRVAARPAGDRLTWAGRVYRVAASQSAAAAPGSGPGSGRGESRAGGYVHLAAVADGGSG